MFTPTRHVQLSLTRAVPRASAPPPARGGTGVATVPNWFALLKSKLGAVIVGLMLIFAIGSRGFRGVMVSVAVVLRRSAGVYAH